MVKRFENAENNNEKKSEKRSDDGKLFL